MIGDLAPTEYREGKNIIVRDGDAETRPGFRRAFSVDQAGFKEAFYFNEENERFNDTDHTGFWLPWAWVGSAWGTIQGAEIFKFDGQADSRLLIVSDGVVFVQRAGFVDIIATSEEIGLTEEIIFVQGNNEVVMFRSGDNNPLRWLGTDQASGFVSFTAPGTTNRIPQATNGFAIFGRLWAILGDNIYASDSLDYDTYDYVYQNFDIEAGDSDELIQAVPFREDYAFCFKKHRIFLMKGINSSVPAGSEFSDFVDIDIVSNQVGMTGKYAYAVAGEQVFFLSTRGVDSLQRVEEGRLFGKDVPLSAPIQPLIDRINWAYAENACAVAFENYLLFSVPMDASEVNNVTLVYDFLAANGKGQWVSTWESELYTPTRYFVVDDLLYFLNSDGALKLMWSDDPWDTEDYKDDAIAYSSTGSYEEGAIVINTEFNANDLYLALREVDSIALTNTDFWEEITDPENAFFIQSEIKTRFYKHGDEASPKKYGRCQLSFLHQNPDISVFIETEDFQSEQTLFEDITYSQVEYDAVSSPHDWTDWIDTNMLFDFNTPYRKDYSMLMDTIERQWTIQELADSGFSMQDLISMGFPANGVTGGLFMDLNGLYLNVWTPHALRFIPRVLKNVGYSLRITNTTGKLKLSSILSTAQQSYFAKRDR